MASNEMSVGRDGKILLNNDVPESSNLPIVENSVRDADVDSHSKVVEHEIDSEMNDNHEDVADSTSDQKSESVIGVECGVSSSINMSKPESPAPIKDENISDPSDDSKNDVIENNVANPVECSNNTIDSDIETKPCDIPVVSSSDNSSAVAPIDNQENYSPSHPTDIDMDVESFPDEIANDSDLAIPVDKIIQPEILNQSSENNHSQLKIESVNSSETINKTEDKRLKSKSPRRNHRSRSKSHDRKRRRSRSNDRSRDSRRGKSRERRRSRSKDNHRRNRRSRSGSPRRRSRDRDFDRRRPDRGTYENSRGDRSGKQNYNRNRGNRNDTVARPPHNHHDSESGDVQSQYREKSELDYYLKNYEKQLENVEQSDTSVIEPKIESIENSTNSTNFLPQFPVTDYSNQNLNQQNASFSQNSFFPQKEFRPHEARPPRFRPQHMNAPPPRFGHFNRPVHPRFPPHNESFYPNQRPFFRPEFGNRGRPWLPRPQQDMHGLDNTGFINPPFHSIPPIPPPYQDSRPYLPHETYYEPHRDDNEYGIDAPDDTHHKSNNSDFNYENNLAENKTDQRLSHGSGTHSDNRDNKQGTDLMSTLMNQAGLTKESFDFKPTVKQDATPISEINRLLNSAASSILSQLGQISSQDNSSLPKPPPPPPPPPAPPVQKRSRSEMSRFSDSDVLPPPPPPPPLAAPQQIPRVYIPPPLPSYDDVSLSPEKGYSVTAKESLHFPKHKSSHHHDNTTDITKTKRGQFKSKDDWQERVAGEVKVILKPHYVKKEINKEEYKDILKKAVVKLMKSNVDEIDRGKLTRFVGSYVEKCSKNHKQKKRTEVSSTDA